MRYRKITINALYRAGDKAALKWAYSNLARYNRAWVECANRTDAKAARASLAALYSRLAQRKAAARAAARVPSLPHVGRRWM